MKKFTSVQDVPDLQAWLRLAQTVKANPFDFKAYGKNKTLGLLFLNPSLRTRLSTQKAAQNLDMQVMIMNMQQDGWAIEMEDGAVMDGGTQEHIREAVGVLSQYCDIIGIRSFPGLKDRAVDYAETVLTKFIEHATVPVVSLESAIRHPLQSFADLLTIEEQKTKARPKVVLSWAPHPRALPQAVPNSFLEWMKLAEVDLSIAHPEGWELAPEFAAGVPVFHDQNAALEGADFVYVKNWSAYREYGKTAPQLKNWMLTPEKLRPTNGAKVMHCLPVRRNVVLSDAVLDSPQSIVLEQANNRTYAAQTVLLNMLGYAG